MSVNTTERTSTKTTLKGNEKIVETTKVVTETTRGSGMVTVKTTTTVTTKKYRSGSSKPFSTSTKTNTKSKSSPIGSGGGSTRNVSTGGRKKKVVKRSPQQKRKPKTTSRGTPTKKKKKIVRRTGHQNLNRTQPKRSSPSKKKKVVRRNTPSAEKLKKWKKECLGAHNECRKLHGVPPLKWDADCFKHATKWAKHLAEKNKFDHSSGNNFGENLYYYSGSINESYLSRFAKESVRSWYNEIKYYSYQTYKSKSSSQPIGHFTQVIWKGTTGVGMAYSISGNRMIIVANYSPPGNVIGRHPQHVKKPVSGKVKLLDENVAGEEEEEEGEEEAEDNVQMTDWKRAVVDAHNFYRRKHGVPDLVWSEKMNSFSKKWAKKLIQTKRMEHSKGSGYGENLYYYMTSGLLPRDKTHFAKEAVKSWYDEIKLYDYSKPGFSMQTGHFTQVVWKNTKKVSMDFADDGNTIFVVANYSPPGNYMGQFDVGVPRLLSGKKKNKVRRK